MEFMNTDIFNAIYGCLAKERGDKEAIVPRSTVKKAIEIYEILGGTAFDVGSKDGEPKLTVLEEGNQFFVEFFQRNLISRLRLHYKAQSEQWLKGSVPEYIQEALNALKFEENQCEFYYPKIKDLVRKAMFLETVTAHSEKLVNNPDSGLFSVLSNKKYGELGQLYDFLELGVPNDLNVLGRAYSKFIESTGEEIIKAAKSSKDPTGKSFSYCQKRTEIVLCSFRWKGHWFEKRNGKNRIGLLS